MTEVKSWSSHTSDYAYFKNSKYMNHLKEIMSKYEKMDQNSYGCFVKPNPRLFGFHVYWKCVGEFSVIVLYFPYLVLTLALVLVLFERILTRYLWTGQRIEKFYNLLVKEVIEYGDIDKVDTKENRQKCRQVVYDFKGSWFYLRAYIWQTSLKLLICLVLISWSISGQCMHKLRDGFKRTWDCTIFDYVHECSIPSNGLNMVIFDLVNVVLALIIILGFYNIYWHWQFRGFHDDLINKTITTNGCKHPYTYTKSKVSLEN